jgi:hypothetical protein
LKEFKLRHRTLKLGLAAATVVAAVLPLALVVPSAYADYAPNKGDVVGVGSDTIQYGIDFLADGNAYGDTGYNQLGNKYKVVDIDATADANARLAYGVDGGQTGQSSCTPGTGSGSGTGNQTSPNSGAPCVLNPTVVLRAGLQPVLRPNGSGAGFNALVQDVTAGHNSASSEVINFARSSSSETGSNPSSSIPTIDQLQIATDTLPMITSGVSTNAVPLTALQLNYIYTAPASGCITWNDPEITGVYLEGASLTASSKAVTFPSSDPQQPTSANDGWAVEVNGAVVDGENGSPETVSSAGTGTITLSDALPSSFSTSTSDNVGLVNPSASGDKIIPLIPQVGSGTRKYFLQQIGLSSNTSYVPACALVSEENDPTAIFDVAGTPADAIEPMSQGRLDLYRGVSNTGASGGLPSGGYFLDPSCAYLVGSAVCETSGSANGSLGTPKAVSPNVVTITASTGTSVTGTTGPVGLGVYSASGYTSGLFDPTRPLFLLFRNSDIASTTAWQPGTTENWLNTLFYDPCPAGANNCITVGSGANAATYGPDGAPYIDSAEGQTLLEDAGITPTIPEICTELTGTDTAGSC